MNRSIQINNKHKILILIIILAGSFLRLYNLDKNELWGDELDVVMKNNAVLKYGLPVVEGESYYRVVMFEYPYLVNSDNVWVYMPWGQNYFAAISSFLLGSSEFSVRLPFVICGILSIVFIYLLAKKLYNREAGLYSLFLSSFSIFLINYTRQARYYMPEILGLVACFYFFLIAMEENKFRDWLFSSLSFVFLFHFNHAFALPVLVTILIYQFYLNRKFSKNFILSYLIAFFLTIPWILYARPWETIHNLSMGGRLDAVTVFYIIEALFERMPVPFLLVGVFLLLRDFRKNLFLSLWLFSCFLMPFLINRCHARGLLPFYVAVIILTSIVLLETRKAFASRIGDTSNYVIWALLFLIVATSIFNLQFYKISDDPNTTRMWSLNKGWSLLSMNFPVDYGGYRYIQLSYEPLRSELYHYTVSLPNDVYGPNRAIVDFLKKNAEKDDVVVTNANLLPIIFGIDLDSYELIGYPSDFFMNLTKNNNLWFVYRSGWKIDPKSEYSSIAGYWINNCKEYTLNAPDLVWGNNPEFPVYEAPEGIKPVKIYYCKLGRD